MALVKKTNTLWQPSENPGLAVGGTMEVTDYQALVKSGMAVLVDSIGNELELPGQKFTCPICFMVTEGLSAFNQHISGHLQKNNTNMEKAVAESSPVQEKKEEAQVVETPVVETSAETVDPVKAKRLAALEKARAARKAK